MNLWAVTMVRDEMDILPHTLQQLVAQGVTGVIVADNMSTDGTWEWLNEPERLQLGFKEFHVSRDLEKGYYQSSKMTALARLAFALDAEWVIPFDADEFWMVTDQGTIADHLVNETADVIQVPLHNYFPTANDDVTEANPFARITHRDPKPGPLPKVIVKNNPEVVIHQGNHGASGHNQAKARRTSIGHFPWRSYEQFERKIRNGHEAYRATDLPQDMGAHWRQYGELLESGGTEALQVVFNTWFLDPPMKLESKPVR